MSSGKSAKPTSPGKSAKPTSRRLTTRQAAFAREYVVDRNGTQAAIRAGYARGGAGTYASELLKNDRVAREIRRLEQKDERGRKVRAAVIRDALLRIVGTSLDDVATIDAAGLRLRDASEVDPDRLAALAGVSERGGLSVRLYDKIRAIELLIKLDGLAAPARSEVSGPDGGPIRTESQGETGITVKGLRALRRMVGLPEDDPC